MIAPRCILTCYVLWVRRTRAVYPRYKRGTKRLAVEDWELFKPWLGSSSPRTDSNGHDCFLCVYIPSNLVIWIGRFVLTWSSTYTYICTKSATKWCHR
ncbi:hypothetical protein L210DRAFT_3558909 [Boletus edulis BED1]|uniref:Uncharacterized protein n=1 Tax=Boletus edulis BED1 TaxID=1328754 RepID=A0AAD4BDP6_BOLED|nr:hypothetical protein L210DRAFT_3572466 [Boletus edulis BED1]KAF8432266.1 hypothetical protein L210DRAFT_3558909 [Boletus edulis BED1]